MAVNSSQGRITEGADLGDEVDEEAGGGARVAEQEEVHQARNIALR
jgi:hypothetical protein